MLSARFEEAFHYASEAHAGQTRKVTGTPYISHLMGVAGLAMDFGADEDEAIAALLHDAGEDQGGRSRLEDIRRRFGKRVAAIVEACSDTLETPKPPWRQRKKAYLAHLAEASPSALLVSAADKLHNARSILADFHEHGDAVFARFNGGRDGTLWYYRELVKAFEARPEAPRALVRELRLTVGELCQEVGEPMGTR